MITWGEVDLLSLLYDMTAISLIRVSSWEELISSLLPFFLNLG